MIFRSVAVGLSEMKRSMSVVPATPVPFAYEPETEMSTSCVPAHARSDGAILFAARKAGELGPVDKAYLASTCSTY